MAPNPTIMKAVEKLDYRVTAGDVASQVGLDVKIAEQGLLALASEAGGHMQVSDTGEIAYLFPSNFRSVLQSKYLRLRLQALWSQVWGLLFYLIRISFGIVLIASIILVMLAIIMIVIAMSASRQDNDDRDSGGGAFFFPHIWFGPDIFWFFSPNYYDRDYSSRRSLRRGNDSNRMSFLESIFSFLFGDGNPNADLEERRWRTVATVIRNNGGAVAAEQIAPYLDDVRGTFGQDEDYMLPVLIRFDGRPEVSPDGQIVYHFPELQVTASDRHSQSVPAYLKESLWRFSAANSGQITLAAGLGAFYLVATLVLGSLLSDGTIAAQIGGLVAFVNGIYGVLLGYAIAFLTIPLIRYFWLKWRNKSVEARNEKRQQQAAALNDADATVQRKIAYAKRFAAITVVNANNLAYTTESDLTEQELAQQDKIDAEWQRRLESGS
jgi:hypothetical protein